MFIGSFHFYNSEYREKTSNNPTWACAPWLASYFTWSLNEVLSELCLYILLIKQKVCYSGYGHYHNSGQIVRYSGSWVKVCYSDVSGHISVIHCTYYLVYPGIGLKFLWNPVDSDRLILTFHCTCSLDCLLPKRRKNAKYLD